SNADTKARGPLFRLLLTLSPGFCLVEKGQDATTEGLSAQRDHSKLQAASRACLTAARWLPRLTRDSKGASCSRRDAVQFEPRAAARPPSQRIGGLAACEDC